MTSYNFEVWVKFRPNNAKCLKIYLIFTLHGKVTINRKFGIFVITLLILMPTLSLIFDTFFGTNFFQNFEYLNIYTLSSIFSSFKLCNHKDEKLQSFQSPKLEMCKNMLNRTLIGTKERLKYF